MKVLRVTMPDGSKWDVPAEVVAESRAASYGEREMFDETMDSPRDLKDWASNNMNWSDVSKVAKMAEPPRPPEIDFQEGWVNGDKEVLDI